MRILSWRLILALTIGVSLVSLASSWYEVQAQRDALRGELERQALMLGERLAGTAQMELAEGDRDGLERLVAPTGNRGHLVAVGIYASDGSAVAMTPGLSASLTTLTQLSRAAMREDRNLSTFTELKFRSVHVLAAPLDGDGKTVTGAIVIVHDSGYIAAAIFGVWLRMFVRVAIEVLVIAGITLLILRWSLSGPIRRVDRWMRDLRMGRNAVKPAAADLDVLFPLTREVGPLAESMQRARAAAEKEARLRTRMNRSGRRSGWPAVRNKLRGSAVRGLQSRAVFAYPARKSDRSVTAGQRTGDRARAGSARVRRHVDRARRGDADTRDGGQARPLARAAGPTCNTRCAACG